MIVRALRFIAALAIGIALAQGCGSKAPKGVAEVPECRSAATNVPKSGFDTGIDYLKRQADAYSDCMTAHGYVLDREQLDEQLNHVEQVQNANVMGGDPFFIVAKRRQELRMSPALWRPAAPSDS
ncbi:MAG TPA: hypothetical protein VMH26_14460 [Burkholderiales bacterium]|nr:hypothetical protein [Burkholderiales bacterium]